MAFSVLETFRIFIIRFTATVTFSIRAGIQAWNWNVRQKAEDCTVRNFWRVKYVYFCARCRYKKAAQQVTVFGV